MTSLPQLLAALLIAFEFALPDALASDSQVPYAPYERIRAEMRMLADLHPTQVRYVEYGRSVEGRPLTMLRIAGDAESDAGKTRPAIEISGAIHGNEYLGIELPLIRRIIEDGDTLPGIHALLARGGVIYAIPVANPDGYSNRVRRNSNEVDLNRDFDEIPLQLTAFTQPETADLAQYLDSDLARNRLGLAFSVDYHCCMAALDIPWAYTNALPQGADLQAYRQLGELERSLVGLPWGNSSQTVHYSPTGTSKDYFYARYGSLSFTFEGRRGGEIPYLDEHLQWIDRALGEVALERFESRRR